MQFLTYAHCKPDGSIFYIGKGSSKRAHSSSGRNVVWKRTVEKHGGFSVLVLAKWNTEQEAFDHEIALIDTFRDMGHKLVNIANGGMGSTGFRHTEAHKTSLSESMKISNPMFNSELREKQKIATKEAMSRPEVRSRISAALTGKKLSKAHIESLRNCHPMRPCIINGVEYQSLMEASRSIGVRHGTLTRWLNNPDVRHNGKYRHITEARWI